MAAQLILGLSILVTLHELGHYLAARAFGIRVEKFYLFFDAWGFKFFSFILTTDALRPDLVNSARCTTIGSVPTITTLPERSSIAVFIFQFQNLSD